MNLVADDRGVVGIQVGLAMVVLLGFCAFSIDYGVMWVARAQAQNAADAGALAGATALAFDNMFNTAVAEQNALALATHGSVWGLPPAAEANICSDPFTETCPIVPGLPIPETRTSFSVVVSVYNDEAHKNALPTYFANLFGVGSQGVRAQATATVVPANVATCVWPLAMPDDWNGLHPADPSLPLPSICTQASDPRCKPFTKYRYPDGPPALVDAPVDAYAPPSTDSDDFSPTGYQLLELEDPMKPTGLEPQIFVDLLGPDPSNPLVWLPARRSSFAAVNIGSGSFLSNLSSCNPAQLHVGDTLAIDPTATWGQATDGAVARSGQDGGASWDDASLRSRGSCAVSGSCGAISPRLVLVPLFDPDRYDQTRASLDCGGRPCISIVNFIGFFIDSSTNGSQIVGHLTTYPGRDIDTTKPFVGYKWAFLRTAVLTR